MHFLWNGDLYLLQVEVQARLHAGMPYFSPSGCWDAILQLIWMRWCCPPAHLDVGMPSSSCSLSMSAPADLTHCSFLPHQRWLKEAAGDVTPLFLKWPCGDGVVPCFAVVWLGLKHSSCPSSKHRQGGQGQRSTPFAGAGECLVWMLDRRHWGTETTAFEREKIISAAPFTLLTLFAWMIIGLVCGHVKENVSWSFKMRKHIQLLKGDIEGVEDTFLPWERERERGCPAPPMYSRYTKLHVCWYLNQC